MEKIVFTYEYVKREIEKLKEPQDKLDRAIELLAIYNVVKDNFERDVIINVVNERTMSKNTLMAKPYLESIIESYKIVLDKPEQEKTYTIKSLAKLLDISTSATYKLKESGKIRFRQPSGNRIYFTQSDVDEYLSKEKSFTEDDIKREAMKYIVTKKGNRKNK